MAYIIDSIELKNEFDACLVNIPKTKWKYLNKRSIENCIKYINSIKGRKDKDQCFSSINDCIQCIKSVKEFDDIDINFCVFLYNDYLKAIGHIYQIRVGFTAILPLRYSLFLLLVLVLIGVIIKNYSITFLIVYGCIIAVGLLYQLSKIIQGKAMGPGY